MSRARYARLLNSDTKLIGNAFEALVRFMDEHPEAAACGPKLLNPDMSATLHSTVCGREHLLLQAFNWHKLFPNSRLMNRYYATEFDYSKAQPVESIGFAPRWSTSAVRVSTRIPWARFAISARP